MNMQGKIWGKTAEVLTQNNFSVHHLEIKKGGYCSEHSHKRKTNLFYVIKGELKISVWRDNGIDHTILTDGQTMTIPINIIHRFKAMTDVQCLEIYESTPVEEDIERQSQGGIELE